MLSRLMIVPVLLLAPLTTALAAADIEKGRRLHDQQCTRCHIERYGGDGSQMYLRKDRLIRDRVALGQRVAMCNTMINAGLFPEDEENVAAYLAQRYYKFK
jgi:mono/diheme cytochrome c family protein